MLKPKEYKFFLKMASPIVAPSTGSGILVTEVSHNKQTSRSIRQGSRTDSRRATSAFYLPPSLPAEASGNRNEGRGQFGEEEITDSDSDLGEESRREPEDSDDSDTDLEDSAPPSGNQPFNTFQVISSAFELSAQKLS